MAVKKYRNEHLDHIKLKSITSISKVDGDMDTICSYALVVEMGTKGTIYWYYNKWQRDKDYLNLNHYWKGKKNG